MTKPKRGTPRGKALGRPRKPAEAVSAIAEGEERQTAPEAAESVPQVDPSTEPGRGRPSKYEPVFASIAAQMCALGATDADLAKAFEVETSTIWRWSCTYPEFCSAIKVGKAACDDLIERSLFQRAKGFTYTATRVMQHQGEPVIVQYDEYLPPDPGACKQWLCNRRPDQWRDTNRTELTGKDGGAIEVEVTPISKFEIARRIALLFAEAQQERLTAGNGNDGGHD
jgi:hypothetical protein